MKHPIELELALGDLAYQEMVEEEQEKRAPGAIPLNWGIRKRDIQLLRRGNLTTCPLEDIFYGTRNLVIPTEVKDVSNSSEIIGIYLAVGILKRHNYHKSNDQIPRKHFSDLVNHMNQIAYDNPIFRRESHNFKQTFSKNPGDQKERLSKLSGETKYNFCRSFWGEYKPSTRESETHGSFIDPLKWDMYIDWTWQGIKKSYERDHWENIKPNKPR